MNGPMVKMDKMDESLSIIDGNFYTWNKIKNLFMPHLILYPIADLLKKQNMFRSVYKINNPCMDDDGRINTTGKKEDFKGRIGWILYWILYWLIGNKSYIHWKKEKGNKMHIHWKIWMHGSVVNLIEFLLIFNGK
eukprot:952883_1